MTFREWLAARNPPPPAPLLAAVVGRVDVNRSMGPDELMEAGQALLAASSEAPGRVRSSAFSLLLADAFVTWACEAALEMDDPDEALRRYLDTRGPE